MSASPQTHDVGSGLLVRVIASGDPLDGKLIEIIADASGNLKLALPSGAATETTLSAMSGKLPASLGAKAPSASISVTGSLASAAPATVADQSVSTKASLGSCAAGPSGVRVQNTSASGNVRVGDTNVSTTRGVQLTPGQWEIFAVSDASLLSAIAESGTVAVGVTAA